MGLGSHLGPGGFHRDAGVTVAVGGVTEHFGDRHAGPPSSGDEASCLGPIRVVGRRRGDTEDELIVVVGEHMGLVAIDPLGGTLATVAHVRVDHRDHPVPGDAVTDPGAATIDRGLLDVLVDDPLQQAARLGQLVVAGSCGEDLVRHLDETSQLGPPGRTVSPVDAGLTVDDPVGGPAQLLGQRLGAAGGTDHLGDRLAGSQAIGWGWGSRYRNSGRAE